MLQKKAIQAIFNLKRDNLCHDYFENNEILSVPAITILDFMKLLKKCTNNEEGNVHHNY